MKKLSHLVLPSLLLLSLAGPALAERTEDGHCKKIQATIVDAQVTEGCTSPNKFCAEGTVQGNHDFNGTTAFRMDGAVRGPATAPGSIATSGVLVYTTDRGTLTVRESGLSGLGGFFTAFQQVLEGTGDYAGATGHFWLAGQQVDGHFETEVNGPLCLQ